MPVNVQHIAIINLRCYSGAWFMIMNRIAPEYRFSARE